MTATERPVRVRWWWKPIVSMVGGLHEFGRLDIGILDSGAMICWDSIIKWEWRHYPPEIMRGVVLRLTNRSGPIQEDR